VGVLFCKEMKMEQHFVTFYSPGTFCSEETTQPIDSWDVDKACEMAHDVVERHAARPYAFAFSTRGRGPNDLDSKETARSATYYLGGSVRTAAEVLAGTDPKEDILRSNVRCNGYKRIITNNNSWQFVGAIMDNDVVLDWTPRAAQTA
jgi:hypothetical protein